MTIRMMRWTPVRAGALVLAAALAGQPAGAAASAPPDPRLVEVDYAPRQVVPVTAGLRAATQIRFAADETIRHVALGDATGWEVAPEGSVLFLRPTTPGPPTNLLVTTRRPEGLRHYVFELRARARAQEGAVFVLQFRYPQDARAAVRRALDARAGALRSRLVALQLEAGVLSGPRNLAYEVQGPASAAPSEVSDNGRFTVLRFPGAQALPAVFAVAPDGAEALVPFHVRGDLLVVHRTARQLRLRLGRTVVCVFNLAWTPAGAEAAGGTAAPGVRRVPGSRP